VVPGQRGQPSRYCDDSAHSRAAAHRSRKAFAARAGVLYTGAAPPATESRTEPVSDPVGGVQLREELADARAEIRLLREQLASVVEDRNVQRAARLRAEERESVADTHWTRAEDEGRRDRQDREEREQLLRTALVEAAELRAAANRS
jgi:hypothetical protein